MDVFKISVPNGIEVGTFDNTNPAPFSARASIWKSRIVIGIVTAQRSTLFAEHVDQLLFLQKNLVLPVIREK